MTFVLSAAIAVLAWAVFSQAAAIREMRRTLADQEDWLRGISEEVRRLPETMRDSEAMRQLLEMLRRP